MFMWQIKLVQFKFDNVFLSVSHNLTKKTSQGYPSRFNIIYFVTFYHQVPNESSCYLHKTGVPNNVP